MKRSRNNRSSSSIKVLVCSGNLGNAPPDLASLQAWIPPDGRCRDVLVQDKNPKYPLPREYQERAANNRIIQEDDKFDLIVIGLQEATFEPPKNEKESKAPVEDEEEMETAICQAILEKEREMEAAQTQTQKQKQCLDDYLELYQDASSRTDTTTTTAKQATNIAQSVHSVARKAVTAVTNHRAAQISRALATLAVNKDHTRLDSKVAPNTTSTTEPPPLVPDDGTALLHSLLETRLLSYKRQVSYQRGQMRLLVYVVNNNSPKELEVVVSSVQAHNTGKGGLANKGGIVATVQINETTTLSFMTCHLQAHEGLGNYERRCASLAEILQGTSRIKNNHHSSKQQQQPPPQQGPMDASLQSHACFVLGDLNFRTRYQGHVYSKDQRDDVMKVVEAQDWEALHQADELQKALKDQTCLADFTTLLCAFPPTFKVERGPGYVYKTNRTPSYTDRILWKTGSLLSSIVTPLLYEPIDDFTSSDHKPLRGAFEIQLNEPLVLPQKKIAQQQELSDDHRRFSLSSLWRRMSIMHSIRTSSTETENLHLYLSDIQCDIFPTGKKAAKTPPPDTHVCIMSNPGSLLLSTPLSRKRKCLHRMVTTCRCSGTAVTGDTGQQQDFTTPVVQKSWNPDWQDYEIHCKLRSRAHDGTPLQLGGAILYIVVFQSTIGGIPGSKASANNKSGRNIIGSFPVNLEYLARACISGNEKGTTDASSSLEWRESLLTREGTADVVANSGIVFHGDTSSMNNAMLSLDINGPMWRNGQHTGILRCSLDVWWVKDSLADAAKAHALANGFSTNDYHETK